MLIIEMDREIQERAKKIFAFKGSIKKAAEKTKIDRTTIPRVIKNGTGDERTVKAITKYVKSIKVA